MRLLALFLGLLLGGCSSLLVRQDDPAPVVVTKTVWRTVLGLSTLGLSEVWMSELREEANAEATPDQRLQDYESHLTYLVNNGALTQAEAEDLYQRYAGVVYRETLEALSAGGRPDLWLGDPTSGYGAAPVWATRSYQPWPPLRSRSSVTRAFVLSKAGASHLRWSRPSPFSRTYSFRTIPTGKAYARRGGRRR